MERARWPDGPVCPKCGVVERASRLSTRPQFTCLDCGHRYSVTSGTAMHRTKLPLQTWMLAMYLIASSSKGISSLKLASLLGVGYRTAWHLSHRIRAMMASEVGLLGGIVELDETYVGGKPRRVHRERVLPKEDRPHRRRGRGTEKACVFVSVERGGAVKTQIVPSHTAGALGEAVRMHVGADAMLMTDELPAYVGVGREYGAHLRVRHSHDEYARTCEETGLRVHVNTAESFNATLKRAIIGVFHYLSPKHLHRYAAEAAFRWNERDTLMDRLATMIRVSPPPLPYGTLVR
jgi:transposase-like protein